MDADQLLQNLAVALELPELRFDANGCARIAVDGAPALNFERAANGSIHLYSVLGSLPLERQEAYYRQMLEGNLFGTATGGAALAVDGTQGEVVLCRTVHVDHVAAADFSTMVEEFVTAAEDWLSKLSQAPIVSGASLMPDAAAALASAEMAAHFLRG